MPESSEHGGRPAPGWRRPPARWRRVRGASRGSRRRSGGGDRGGNGRRWGRRRPGSAGRAPALRTGAAAARARRLVSMLGAVVRPRVPPVPHPRGRHAPGRAVAGALIRDRHARRVCRLLAQVAPGARGRRLVAPRRDAESEHVALPVDRPPQGVPHPVDADAHLVALPVGTGRRRPLPERSGGPLAARPAPLPDGFGGQHDAPLGERRLDRPVAEREAAGPPHGVRADRGRQPVALVAGDTRLLLPGRRSA